jgi:hypothetical protein
MRAVTLNVHNAFNSAPWQLIDEALRRRKIPTRMNALLRSYMSDRTLLVGEDMRERRVICGVPQGPSLVNDFKTCHGI